MTDDLTPQIAPILPQVVVNGEQASQDRIDPNIAQFIMQAAQTAQLVRLRKLEESKVPVAIKPLRKNITPVKTRIYLFPRWISFTLINDGPGAVTVAVNDDADYTGSAPSMVPATESIICDMTYPVIWLVCLWSAPGTTATVRIYSKEGKS